MTPYRQQLINEFQKRLAEEYKSYCLRHELDTCNLTGLLSYLIDKELISATHIQRYTILSEFDDLYPRFEHHKTDTVKALSDRFQVSERTIWNALRFGNRIRPKNKKSVQ